MSGFLAGHHSVTYIWGEFLGWSFGLMIFVGVDNSAGLRGTICYPSFEFA